MEHFDYPAYREAFLRKKRLRDGQASTAVQPNVNWLSPRRWIDLTETIALANILDDAIKVDMLKLIFEDLLVDRPTHLSACIRGYKVAAEASNPIRELTSKQEAAIHARDEAMKAGRKDIQQAVAEALGITQQAASARLQNADAILEAKTLYNDAFFAVGENASGDALTPNEESRVQRWMASRPHQCAGYGRPEVFKAKRIIPACEGTAPPGRDLCWDCLQVYGTRGSWGEDLQWLDYLVGEHRREHRANAIAAVRREPDVIRFPEQARERRRYAAQKIA